MLERSSIIKRGRGWGCPGMERPRRVFGLLAPAQALSSWSVPAGLAPPMAFSFRPLHSLARERRCGARAVGMTGCPLTNGEASFGIRAEMGGGGGTRTRNARSGQAAFKAAAFASFATPPQLPAATLHGRGPFHDPPCRSSSAFAVVARSFMAQYCPRFLRAKSPADAARIRRFRACSVLIWRA